MVAERFHVPLLLAQKRLRLTHVVERHWERSKKLQPPVQTVRTVEELWESDVDVVIVLTPNESHFELAAQALRAGKHVVVDKPFTVTTVQADELIELSHARGLLLTVFHNRRWDNDFLTLRELVAQGAVGRLRRLESRWERHRPEPKGDWREQPIEGMGVLYDLGSHLIDQVLQLFGSPGRILSHLQIQRENVGAVDCFDLTFDYGTWQACLRSDCLTPVPSHRFAIYGDSGSYLKHGLDPQEDALKTGALPLGPNWGAEPVESWGTLKILGTDGKVRSERIPTLPGNYGEFYRNLAAALAGDEPLHVTAEQAREVILALELCLESQKTGRWVDWPSRGGTA